MKTARRLKKRTTSVADQLSAAAHATARQWHGKRVRVHRPGWTDAAGRVYPDAREHGWTGVVLTPEGGRHETTGDQPWLLVEIDGKGGW